MRPIKILAAMFGLVLSQIVLLIAVLAIYDWAASPAQPPNREVHNQAPPSRVSPYMDAPMPYAPRPILANAAAGGKVSATGN